MAKKVFGFGDVHWAYRHEESVDVLLRALKMFKPDRTYIGGDLVSFDAFSDYKPKSMADADEREHDWLELEVNPACAFLDQVQAGTAEKTVFIEGNHEARVSKWASRNGGVGRALYNTISPRILFPKGRKQFKYVPYGDKFEKSYEKIHRDLVVIHGWSAARQAASKTLDKAKSKSVIFHHSHKEQSETRHDPFSGKPIWAKSPGCLCEYAPLYTATSPTEWSRGFWVGYIGKSSYTVYMVPIEKGYAVLPDGREVKV